jgi:predicted Zn-dependent protease
LNDQVRFNLAVAYYKAALLSQAEEEFEKVASADSSNKNAVRLLADCRLQEAEYKKVIALLEPLVLADPNDLAAAYMLGTAYIKDGQPEKGQLLIDRILRNGESAEAHLMMGTARYMIRDFTGAEKEFERAIELNPKLPTVHSVYGKALLGAGERERAAKAFQDELMGNPNDFDANLYTGMLLKEDEKYDDALAYLKRARILRPRDLNVLYFVANVILAVGRTVDAQGILEDIVKQSPEFVEAHVLLATVYYRLKRKGDGDRERAVILKLNAERQAEAPGAKEGLGPAYRGEPIPLTQPNRKPDARP